MKIIHIASIGNNAYSGIFVVAPQHIKMQQKTEQVAFINISNIFIEGICNQYKYTSSFNILSLPNPFSKPDLIVFHGVYIPAYLKIYKQLIEEKIPYIIIPHGSLTTEALNKKKMKKRVANKLFFNNFIEKAIAIQYLSQVEYDSSHYGSNKFICTNGMSFPIERKNEFHLDKITISYIGRLDAYHKGLDLMIYAIKKVEFLLKKNNCIINLYGPNLENQASMIKRMIFENNIGDIIKFHDGIVGEEKKTVLLDTDIFIQTSRFEGMPMGILEALSYGIPCLVTIGTTLGTVVEKYNAGWCADTSIDAIAEKISEAVQDRINWKLKSYNAQKLIKNEFEWNKVCEKELMFYQHFANLQ